MMSEMVNTVLQWLNTHPEYSWFITFAISASESIAVIGTIIPGSITMTALGALAGAGIIPLWSTLFWAFLGAVVGDSISYGIGFYFKERLCLIWPFRRNLTLLKQGEKFFTRYGGMSVFIGRFIGPIRALIPVVAGMMGMKPSHFLIANIASAAGWAPAYMLPGILLGAVSLELPPDIATRVTLRLLFWSLFILLCLWLIRKIPIVTHRHIIRLFNRLWTSIQSTQCLHRTARLIKHHHPEKTSLQLALAFYFLIICAVFIYLASYIATHASSSIFINNSIYHFFRGIHTETGKEMMIYLTLFGQKQIIIPVICIIIGWLLITKRWHTALHALGLCVITMVCVVGIKHSIHSQRPWGVFSAPHSYSFPSGHATLAATFYIGLALLISQFYNGPLRKLMYVGLILIVLAVSVSRLYLGVHWFTDILGAWLLSAAILTLVTISYSRKQEAFNPKKLLLIIVLAFAMIYALVAHLFVPRSEVIYSQLDWPTQESTTAEWWEQQNKNFLPEWQVSLFGFPSQPLNIEWRGELSSIEKTLLKNGWEVPPEQEWTDVLFRLSGIESTEHLPLVSPLYLDKKPVLVLVKRMLVEKKILVLQLWKSNVILKETQGPLWVGVVGAVPRTFGWLTRKYKINITITPEDVFKTVPSNEAIKVITITIPHAYKDSTQTVLLIK